MSIFLTFDFELFLGGNPGTIENCLIYPTKEILKIANHNGAKLTFFVDCAYLWRLRAFSKYVAIDKEYALLCDFLTKLSRNGHDIQIHFHPQWLYSVYNGDNWVMDLNHYKLSDVDNSYLKDVFHESVGMLKNIALNNICAFRAGGYSIQSYKEFPSLFKENNIHIDSSVIPKSHIQSAAQSYDYRAAPAKPYWRFEREVTKEVDNGPFIELPITTMKPITGFEYALVRNYFSKKHGSEQVFGDGESISHISSTYKKYVEYMKKLFSNHVIMASMDNILSENLVNLYQTWGKECFVAIGHPKNFNNKSLQNLDTFLGNVNKKRDDILTLSLFNNRLHL